MSTKIKLGLRGDKKDQLTRRPVNIRPARSLSGQSGIVMGQVRPDLKTDQTRSGLNSKPMGSPLGLYVNTTIEPDFNFFFFPEIREGLIIKVMTLKLKGIMTNDDKLKKINKYKFSIV